MSKTSSSTIVLSILIILLLIGIFCSSKDKLNKKPLPPMDKNELSTMGNLTDESKLYVNEELGFRFKYKGELINSNFTQGESGQSFKGEIEIDNDTKIMFGGISVDYSASRGGSITDFQEIDAKEGKYIGKWIWGEVPLSPYLTTENNAILVKDTEIGMILTSTSYTAFIGLNNKNFKGLVLHMIHVNSHRKFNTNQVQRFEKLVESIEVW